METGESSFGASSFIPCSRENCYIFLLSARPFVKWVGKANRRVMDPTGNCKNWRKTLTRLALRLPTCSFNRLTVEPRNRLLPQSCTPLSFHYLTRLLLHSCVPQPFTPFTVYCFTSILPHPFTPLPRLLLRLYIASPVYSFIRSLRHPFSPSTDNSITR